jgi:LPXTG-motif cell wall-anchored protein
MSSLAGKYLALVAIAFASSALYFLKKKKKKKKKKILSKSERGVRK